MSVKLIGPGIVSEESIGLVGDALVEFEEASDLELLEFLAADIDPIPADPIFRQELGEALWELVQSGSLPQPRRH